MIRTVPNRITINYEELNGSPTEGGSYDFWSGLGVAREVLCLSTDRLQLIKEFLGYWVGPTYHRPHPYLDLDPTGILVATHFTTKPFGKIEAQEYDTRLANYPKTIINFTYSIPPEAFEAFGGLVTVTESMRGASEFLTCSTKGLYWYVDGVANEPIDEFDAPGKVNDLTEWIYEIRGTQTIPAGVWGFPGSVNEAVCYSRTYDRRFPAETLLCMPPEVTQERTFTRTSYTIRLRFLAKNNGTYAAPLGWNHFPRRSITADVDVSYERMVRAVNAADTLAGWKLFYPLADFSTIFVP